MNRRHIEFYWCFFIGCAYIFRYYKTESDNFLTKEDVQRMLADIAVKKNDGVTQTVNEEIFVNGKIDFKAFLKEVSDLRIRGTSVLFRAENSLLNRISNRRCELAIREVRSNPFSHIVLDRKYRGICQNCRRKRYCLTGHGVKISSKSVEESFPLFEINQLEKFPNFKHYERVQSFEIIYKSSSDVHKVLQIVQELGKKLVKKSKIEFKQFIKNKLGISEGQMPEIAQVINRIFVMAKELFSKETRILDISSPCFIFGDIHGKLSDLLIYQQTLWKTVPLLVPSKYVFLGDFVDRGEYGIESVLYLFCLKILAPDKFFICRGNHEIRSIQETFTFKNECQRKFGKEVGNEIWENCNKVFDTLPWAVIVDNSIFGSHGGIPASTMRKEQLNKIPCPLPDPENDSPAAWEMVWNDPVNPDEFRDFTEFDRVKDDTLRGFLKNKKRGTAYYYGDESVDTFFKANGISQIIRAHEVMPNGYKFHLNGKVLTVFSSSNYCGLKNKSACIFVDQYKLRVIQIDT